jgi:hypothetical protein
MNEGKARDKIDRGAKAETLLRNELLQEAFDYLESEFTGAWKQSAVEDSQARERLYLLCQNLSAVKNYLKSAVEDGKLAQSALEGLKTNRKF